MDIIRELNSIQNWLEDNAMCGLSYEIHIVDNEIKLDLSIGCAWETHEEHKKNFNACDFKTNIEGAENFVRNFDYKGLDEKYGYKKTDK